MGPLAVVVPPWSLNTNVFMSQLLPGLGVNFVNSYLAF